VSDIPQFASRFLRSVLCLIGLANSLPALWAGDGGPELFRAGGGRRVRLWDGERVSGQILDLNQDILRLRTVWAARLELPRAAVASIEPLPGWRTIIDEDFRHKLGEPAVLAAGLRFSGEPTFADAEDGTAARACVLRTAGQSMTYTPAKPLSAGRVGVNFQERGQARGARWTVELLFQQGERKRRVTLAVAGDSEYYTVDTGDLTGTIRRVKRRPGWHRLIVQFRKHSLRLTCDDDVLWHNLDDGPSGRLQRVTIACQRLAEREALRGAVAWTEFCIERAVDEHPQSPAEVEQDAVRLLDDDQLFGRILYADRRALQIEGRFGKRSLPWTALSGCSFRRPAAPPKANEGAKVRLLVRSGLCEENDVLEGVVSALDERRLVLRHALLGEVTLERGRVREMQSLPVSSK
jgi:hypothetical protein